MWITKFPDDSWLRIPRTISRGSDSTRLLNYDVCIRINAADIRKRHDKIRQNVALSLVFGMFFARATAVPCFARYFILATAVNLVQDQIWSWSSRTFHIEFDRVNQSVWSVRYFNFSIFKSFRNKGWTAFFRIFLTLRLASNRRPKNRLSITYISQILAKLFLRKQHLWKRNKAISILRLSIFYQNRYHGSMNRTAFAYLQFQEFPFRTIDNATLHNYKEQRNGGW